MFAYNNNELDAHVIFHSLQKKSAIKITSITVNVDKRGDLISIAEEKIKIGVLKHFSNDNIVAFASNYVFPVINVNVMYVSKYSISTHASIPLIAKNVAKIGKQKGVTGSTYGCTGRGTGKSA
jgi:argininosuccinate synthase